MESFVEDLLNLRMLREGLFILDNAPFNLLDVLDFVVSIFKSKLNEDSVSISYSYEPQLEDHAAEQSRSDCLLS